MDLTVKNDLSQLISIRKRKRTNILGEFISLEFLCQRYFGSEKGSFKHCSLSEDVRDSLETLESH